MIDVVHDISGGLDVLVNDAGIGITGSIVETSEDDIDRALSVNAAGPLLLTKAAIPLLSKWASLEEPASIVFTASGLGLHGRAGAALYAMTKHAVFGLMRSCALELGHLNIRSNAVCPGFLETPLTRTQTEGWGNFEDVRESFSKSAPLNRTATAEAVASAIYFLATRASSSITGVALPVDCGEHETTAFVSLSETLYQG